MTAGSPAYHYQLRTTRMTEQIHGIHHITAIAADPQATIDFYTRVLGVRLVKLTVNFDDPGTYHLYFGDSVGSPGSILTFFPFTDTNRGRVGNGQVSAIAYAIPRGSFDFWSERLARSGVRFGNPLSRFGDLVLSFVDPDGLPLELVEHDLASSEDWAGGPAPAEHAITRFAGAAISLASSAETAGLLADVLGFKTIGTDGERQRFLVGQGQHAQTVDLLIDRDAPIGRLGAGTVHHIAWRCSEIEQREWRERIERAGHHVTAILDRNYFRSIYFREPGGVLFELATDEPGFTVDQELDALGTRLMLPKWLEPQREQIERRLPPLRLPEAEALRQ